MMPMDTHYQELPLKVESKTSYTVTLTKEQFEKIIREAVAKECGDDMWYEASVGFYMKVTMLGIVTNELDEVELFLEIDNV